MDQAKFQVACDRTAINKECRNYMGNELDDNNID